MNDNEYLQEKVMGKCCHSKLNPLVTGGSQCDKCGEIGFSSELRIGRMDFSLPTDYCALEDKMGELGEWKRFRLWLIAQPNPTDNKVFIDVWCSSSRSQRAALIAEYWRQR